MKVHSAAWFQHKVEEATRRIDQDWPKSMRENAVVASASLPCVEPITAAKARAHQDQALRQAMRKHRD